MSAVIPRDVNQAQVSVKGKVVRLTNLDKLFWPDLQITKRDLLQYYADVSKFLLPHIKDRAMVMKRYPHGAYQDFFFMSGRRRRDPSGSRSVRSIMVRRTSLIFR